ncbi:MAG: DegV family protein [Caldilineaceae bacterium]
MTKVRIVTDSGACLPADLIERYAIEIIPHRIKIGNSIFEEGSDFGADDLFFELHANQAHTNGNHRLPEVLPADTNTILNILTNPHAESEQILAIHASGELSSMAQQVRRASEMIKGRYTIRVLDSLSISYGLRLLVEEAAQLAEQGAQLSDITRIINGAVPHIYLASFTESLNYLERSAYLSPSQSLLGTMLGIKAMLMMEEGKLATLEKVQNRDEVVEKLQEFVLEFAYISKVGVFQHGYEKQRTILIDRLSDALPRVKIEATDYAPSLASYVGPNTIGVIVYEGNRN